MDETEVGPELDPHGHAVPGVTGSRRSESLKWWAAIVFATVGIPELAHLFGWY